MSVSVSQWRNKSSLLGVFSLQFDRCWAFLILLCQTKLTLGISLQIKTLRCPPCPGFIMSEHLHARPPSEDDWSVPHPPCCTPLILYLSSYLNTFSIKSEKEGRGMGDPWGRGAERSLCHWRGRERGREGGREKEGGRERDELCPICGEKSIAVHMQVWSAPGIILALSDLMEDMQAWIGKTACLLCIYVFICCHSPLLSLLFDLAGLKLEEDGNWACWNSSPVWPRTMRHFLEKTQLSLPSPFSLALTCADAGQCLL